MNYNEVMDYLGKAKKFGSIPGLEVMSALMDELGNPQNSLSFVHVAGTNGKGSICAFLSEICRQAGLRTGLYISPFIQHFGERIQIDGKLLGERDTALCFSRVIEAAQAIEKRGFHPPTVFELTTAAAFVHFADNHCDIVVLEVGLGGRLDATNIISCPEVAVIGSIGLDHTEILGTTPREIAAEKGGIIKNGSNVVLLSQAAEVNEVIEAICRERNACLSPADPDRAKLLSISAQGQEFLFEDTLCKTRLVGLHQIKNALAALLAARVLCRRGWSISRENIAKGLENAFLIGRMETLSRSPAVIVDGAHNAHGVLALRDTLQMIFPGKKIIFVMGMMADKGYDESISIIAPLAKRFYTSTAPIGRALPARVLADKIRSITALPAYELDTPELALGAALDSCRDDDIVCAFGTLYQIGQIRRHFGLEPGPVFDLELR